MINFAASKGVAVLNAAPYAGGVLAKGSESFPRYVYQEVSARMLDPVRRVEAIYATHGVPPGCQSGRLVTRSGLKGGPLRPRRNQLSISEPQLPGSPLRPVWLGPRPRPGVLRHIERIDLAPPHGDDLDARVP
jgi:hypothetical protein